MLTLDATDSPKVSQKPPKPLKSRYQLFVNEYIVTKNAAEACRRSGYTTKTPNITGYKLLQNPKVRQAIDAIEAEELAKVEEKTREVQKLRTKDGFIDTAWKEYENPDNPAPVKLRALEIAGKSLGHLDNNAPQIVNQTLIINNVELAKLNATEAWDKLRALLGE